MKKKIGKFEIEIWDGGTIWCVLRMDGGTADEFRFKSEDLHDLRHAVSEMMRISREQKS